MLGFYGERGRRINSSTWWRLKTLYISVSDFFFFLSARFAIYFYFICVCVLKNVTHTPFHAPRSRQMPSSPPPRAARVCRRAPGQSGKSWTCGDWRAAASQSEPSTRRPHWRHNRERQQLRVIEHILQSHKRDKKSFQKPFSFSLQ